MFLGDGEHTFVNKTLFKLKIKPRCMGIQFAVINSPYQGKIRFQVKLWKGRLNQRKKRRWQDKG